MFLNLKRVCIAPFINRIHCCVLTVHYLCITIDDTSRVWWANGDTPLLPKRLSHFKRRRWRHNNNNSSEWTAAGGVRTRRMWTTCSTLSSSQILQTWRTTSSPVPTTHGGQRRRYSIQRWPRNYLNVIPFTTTTLVGAARNAAAVDCNGATTMLGVGLCDKWSQGQTPSRVHYPRSTTRVIIQHW